MKEADIIMHLCLLVRVYIVFAWSQTNFCIPIVGIALVFAISRRVIRFFLLMLIDSMLLCSSR